MGRALIVVESLAAALLLVALVAAWAVRRPGRGTRWGVPLAVVVLVAGPAAFVVYGLGFLHRMGTVSLTQLVVATVWTAAFVTGSLVLIRSAPRAAADPAAPRPWSVRSFAAAFGVAAVLTAVTVSNMDVAAKGQLAAVRVEAGARAAALAPPPPPDAQNAAPVYRKAFAALAPPDQLPAALRGDDRPAFDPTDPGLREFLDAQQRGLALLRQAAALPQAGFDRDLGDDSAPLDVPVPELPLLQHGATLLAADARARAARGDSRGAIDDVAAVFGIARHVRFPLLIDLLTAAVIERVGAAALEDVLAAAPAKADDLGRLKLSPGDPFQPYLRRVFAMEEAWGMAAIAMIATGRADGSPEVREQTGLGPWGEAPFALAMYRVFFLEEDLAAYRRHLRTMREHAARPAPQMLDGFAEHERQIKSNRGGGILAGLLLPAAYRLMFAALDADAVHALARTAVAAAAYKAKHGKYPERLGELVPEFLPEVPADPYDGRPVRLRRADGGLVLYSVGRDRKDDAGRPWEAEKQAGDLVFQLK